MYMACSSWHGLSENAGLERRSVVDAGSKCKRHFCWCRLACTPRSYAFVCTKRISSTRVTLAVHVCGEQVLTEWFDDVLHFHVLLVGPSFSHLAISHPVSWFVIFTSCILCTPTLLYPDSTLAIIVTSFCLQYLTMLENKLKTSNR